MHEQKKQQHVPVKVYRTEDRLMVVAPMPGLESPDIAVEVAQDGRLTLHGDSRAMLKDIKELLIDEWSAGAYHRELTLPAPVDGKQANVTYGNGVVTVSFPIAAQTVPAHLTLERIAATRGLHKGLAGHPAAP